MQKKLNAIWLLGLLLVAAACSNTSTPNISVDKDAQWETLAVTRAGYADVGNRVWWDVDRDGLQQKPTEPGIDNIKVDLYEDNQCDGSPDTLIQSTQTREGGWYRFNELDPGKTYVVKVILPEGAAFTSKYALGMDHSGRDSDVNPNSGLTDCFRVEADMVYSGFDAGLIGDVPAPQITEKLGNRVWFDLNRDGLQQKPTEPGIDGITVNLYTDVDCNDEPDALLGSTETKNGGWYLFSVNPTNNHILEFVLPDGKSFTTPNAGADGADSDVNPDTGRTNCIRPYSNSRSSFDAGLIESRQAGATVGNRVWQDSNGDGLQQKPTEPGVDGVVVNLYEDTQCDGTANTLLQSTETREGGWYWFNDVSPTKTYVIEVVRSENQAFTRKYVLGMNHSGRDSDVNPDTGLTDCFRVEADTVYSDFDAGLVDTPVGTATVGNRVWLDSNQDGLQQKPEEPGVDGVTVNLYEDIACTGSADVLLQSTRTQNGGWYWFNEVSAAKTYTIEVVLPAGTEFTTKYVLGMNHSGRDSDVNPGSGLMDCFRVEADTVYSDFDAGIVEQR